ncbi:4-hydroxy-tetrahydrodipicolinate reductase [Moraxella sp. Tifton1]|uniref:4-hydroxy-tetrahydrodipicolinate reductase n=1 Tax=Moraxella oculi TaxID=2940516 RepID=UPI002012B4A2|nr:4-hydroxy-tetrahydrodipicolinate reductase [Moraxella sp. Tifton1]MCL1624086.1 4-hydroxy-tetrahydrodipicolinate reductase [Moraxella sp. Tifton1]
MKNTNIGIMGASGRMGRMLLQATLDHADTTLKAGFVPSYSSLIGVDAGEFIGESKTNVALSAFTDSQSLKGLDVLIDFSLPDAVDATVAACVSAGIPMVMGVTGLSEEQEIKLKEAARKIAIVYAGNYSTGVNLSLNLLATTAKVLGMEADIEIIEHHHQHKLDAPSGTALMMAKSIADARGQSLKTALIHGRHGTSKRNAGEIGIHAVRGGEIIGEHAVEFIMNGEIVTITHKAMSRTTFASGAVKAANWVYYQPAGLYDMQDVLGIKSS